MSEESGKEEADKTDELEAEVPSETPETPQETETPEVDPAETLARSGGWVSKDEWTEQGKDPALWRDAPIFNERGEFMRKISNLSKQVKSQASAMKDLADHHKRVAEFERSKILNELKKQKADAMREDNFERVVELDDQISDIKNTAVPDIQVPQPDEKSAIEEMANQWVASNQWYKNDPDLRNQANVLMAGHKAMNPNAAPEDIFAFAATGVRSANPAKFKPASGASPVASGERTTAPRGGKKSMPKLSDLDFEHQKVARNFESLGIMPADEYIAELVKTGEIEWNK